MIPTGTKLDLESILKPTLPDMKKLGSSETLHLTDPNTGGRSTDPTTGIKPVTSIDLTRGVGDAPKVTQKKEEEKKEEITTQKSNVNPGGDLWGDVHEGMSQKQLSRKMARLEGKEKTGSNRYKSLQHQVNLKGGQMKENFGAWKDGKSFQETKLGGKIHKFWTATDKRDDQGERTGSRVGNMLRRTPMGRIGKGIGKGVTKGAAAGKPIAKGVQKTGQGVVKGAKAVGGLFKKLFGK